MKTIKMLTMAAVCATAMTGWARTMSVTSIANGSVTLAFGEPNGTNYTLCVAYGNASGGENKYKWTSFSRNVAMIEANQTTYTYQLPSEFTSGTFYRFFLLQTENLPYERELEYIQSTSTAYGTSQGTQFIDTGIVGKSGIKMDANYVWLAGKDSTILGSRTASGDGRFYVSHMYWNTYWCRGYGTWSYGPNVGYKSGDAFHVVCELKSGLQTLVVNDVQMYRDTNSANIDTKLNMYVFGCNYGGVQKVCIKAQLFDMKIWQNNALVRNYYPVFVNGDGALYDGVSGEIFPNGSSTPFVLGEAADEENRRGIVRAVSQDFEVLTDEEYQVPVTAYWEGGTDGDLSKDANWHSINRIGAEVAAAPVSATTVHFSGNVNASWASVSNTLGAAKIVCEDVHLATNCDWRVFGSVPFEGNLDLNGWKLQLAGLTGTGAITDRPLAVAGYEALDYIESTGKNYINTGVTGAPGATVEADMMGVQSMGYDLCVVGSRKGGMRFLPFWAVHNSVCFGYNVFKGGDNYGHHANDGFVQNKRYVGYNRMRDGSQNTYMNGLHAHHGDIAGEYDTGLNMYIFSMNHDGTAKYFSRMRLYAARFWTGGGAQLVRDFVPAKRTSDGVLGLYDKVNGNFHEKQGSGSFNAGAKVVASGPAGELWVEVAKGVTNVNTGVMIAGSTKLVKSGKGVYQTMVLNQTYTGGTRVADGTFGQGVTSANDSMPLGQNEVTIVFEKEADVEWEDGCYFSWETRPANTTFILPSAMQAKGFIMTEEPDGIYIKNPNLIIFIR